MSNEADMEEALARSQGLKYAKLTTKSSDSSKFSDWEKRGDGPYHADPRLQRETAFNAGLAIGQAENASLIEALEEIREVWAGSDGFVAETAPEGYLQKLLKQCYTLAVYAMEIKK